jgi:5-methylcytosine-specific restriction protein A
MCECPHCKGKDKRADTVDHIKPHRGDRKLFADARNLQSMHRQCHSKFKQSLEKGGHGFTGFDESGLPLDPDHPYNAP